MIDYSHRSYKKELLDGDNIPFKDIAENLKELDFINSYLGGHSITIKGFKKLAGNKETISVCEIGCGGGDNINAIYDYCKRNNIVASFEGVDINPDCIAFARKHSRVKNVNFISSDYKKVTFKEGKPDIIFSSLFCHHFNENELLEMFQWMKQNAVVGFFINDLHRHPLAYNFIKAATKLFSKSYLVKNDAPLSVLRGFKENEWKAIFKSAGIDKYFIEWKWAFRYLIIVGSLSENKNQSYITHKNFK
ncbi:MAG: methyltransferase domain-containing protein [Ginsengibacter sp.]